MTFFPTGKHATFNNVRGISHETLHANGCNLCPLNHQTGFSPLHPQMPAHGVTDPIVYMLGEAPGATEDQEGQPFVGSAGSYLRDRVPHRWLRKLRWNNVVRTRPAKNATPTEIAIECCRPSIIKDIEKSAPEAIFGFGNIPLNWAIGQNGIRKWNGRKLPVKIGDHTCWYFPLLHPSYVLHLDNDKDKKLYEQMSFVFDMDIRRAFQEVEDGLPDPIIHTREDAESGIDLLHNEGAIHQALGELMGEDEVGIDLETVGTRPYAEKSCILTVALSGAERTIAFPLYHQQARWTDKQRESIERALVYFLRDFKGGKISFSLAFELEQLAYFYGNEIIYAGAWGDAQAQAYLLDGRQGTLDLDFVCLNLFGINIKALTNVDRDKLDETPLDTVLLYNGVDAKYHRLAHDEQQTLLDDRGLIEPYEHHVRRQQAAVLMQIKGIPVTPEVTENLVEKYEGMALKVEKEIRKLDLAKKFKRQYGHEYRPSAPKDTQRIFSLIGETLKTTQEEEILKIDHPLAKLHIAWKEAHKILSTYINPYRIGGEDSVVWPDGMIHHLLLLTRVRTWRSSSKEPNVQNAPKHFGDAHEVRDQIQAPPGHKLVSIDYGQIQARNVAMESKDEALVKSFWDRHDIHCDWRDRIFQLYPRWAKEGLKTVLKDEKLMKFYRNRAKNAFVFASFFEAGGKKVAETLGIPTDIGYKLAEEFDAAFPECTQWHQDLHDGYDQNGYVTGLSGFRRYAPVSHTEVVNTPIQGDEAIIVFDGMARLCEMEEPDLVPILMIHDDLTFMWPEKKVEHYAEIAIDTLLNCPFEWTKIVPLSVEMSVGQSWDKMSEVKSYGPLESDKWTGKLRKIK